MNNQQQIKKRANKQQAKFKQSAKKALCLFVEYCEKNKPSNNFIIHFYDMLKNAIKTQNKAVLSQMIEILESVPKNRKTEKEILNSIRYDL